MDGTLANACSNSCGSIGRLAGEDLAAEGVEVVHRDPVRGLPLQQLHDWPPEDTKLPHHHRAYLLFPWERQLPLQLSSDLQRQDKLN